jgi:hypothetical protein
VKDTAQALELDKDYILSNSLPVYPQCGIYFLIQDDEIVYIGQSIHIPNRLHSHQKKNRQFERVFFVECKEEDLDEIERQYIRKFSPKLNHHLIVLSVAPESVQSIDFTPEAFKKIDDEYKEARQRRNFTIRQMRENDPEYWTFERLAGHWGMSKQAVQYIYAQDNEKKGN